MRKMLHTSLLIALSMSILSCGPAAAIDIAHAGSAEINHDQITADQDDRAHSSDADPDYETVFPQDTVNRIDIVISPENWAIMQEDMTALYGEAGSGGMGNRPGGGEGRNMPLSPPEGEIPDDAPGWADRQPPRNAQPMRSAQTPVWVEATVFFENDVWEHVGIRYKGNSTLRQAWSSGSLSMPFKLDFDQYEDDYPETEDQRFYGFKQLTLANNIMDASYLREVTASEVFGDAGLVIAESALYEVYLDYGEGPQYIGLYTMVEVVEDTVVERAFGDDDGAIYKAEGVASSFAEGTRSQLDVGFDLENDAEDPWNDLQELYDILHDSLRAEDPEAWRTELEGIFNVDSFLNWLAVNTLTQDWDTYGNMSHNYYLFHHPETGLLEWIAWDKSWAFSGDGGMRPALSMSLDEVAGEWPLIRYLIDDPVYAEVYRGYLEQALETAFHPDRMRAWYEEMAELVQPYLEGESEIAAFERALQQLIAQAEARYEAGMTFLAD